MKQGYERFGDLFSQILQLKKFVVNLNGNELRNFKFVFYNQKFPTWRLDMLWEFIWSDVEYERMFEIFKNSKII